MDPLRAVASPPDAWLLAAGLGLLGCVAASWSARRWWIGELISHWTLHVAAVLAILAAASAARGAWLPALLWSAGAAAGAAPWLRAREWRAGERAPDRPAGGPRMTLVSANLLFRNRRRPAALAALAAQSPALVVLLEVVRADEAALRGDPRWPHQRWCHDDRRFGSAILSAWPLTDEQVAEPRHGALLAATAEIAGRRLRVIACHPFAPHDAAQAADRNRQFAALAALMAGEALPVVAAGDFNCTPGSPYWGALLRGAGCRRQRAFPATYPAWLGPFGIPIDHVLARGLALRGVRALRLPGSDHRALAAELELPPS
jgi:endonuclease/exonuclease/phosphatase (EEP) superfamily protein YafD